MSHQIVEREIYGNELVWIKLFRKAGAQIHNQLKIACFHSRNVWMLNGDISEKSPISATVNNEFAVREVHHIAFISQWRGIKGRRFVQLLFHFERALFQLRFFLVPLFFIHLVLKGKRWNVGGSSWFFNLFENGKCHWGKFFLILYRKRSTILWS